MDEVKRFITYYVTLLLSVLATHYLSKVNTETIVFSVISLRLLSISILNMIMIVIVIFLLTEVCDSGIRLISARRKFKDELNRMLDVLNFNEVM